MKHIFVARDFILKRKNTRPKFIKLVYAAEILAKDLVYVKFGADLIEQNDVRKEQSNEMKVDEY